MDFLTALLALASSQNISHDDAHAMHQNYCQNLYWQANPEEKLEQAGCDMYETDREISRVHLGRY